MSSSKRADLQGIRGLAILAVLLFHFFPKHFPNGYIGVDQFFVLSGFLISMILSRKQVSGYGMCLFYYRRVKRIVPMYLLVILFLLISLFTVFPRTNLETNMESAWNALLFNTNMAVISEDRGYEIALMVAEDAFTHAWSLAVEMQFYLLVPFIFLVSRDRIWSMLLLVVSASLVFSLLVDQNTSFNSVIARLWQICIGGISNLLCDYTPPNTVDKQPLLENNGTVVVSHVHWHAVLLTNVLLFLSVFQEFYPVEIPDTMLRVSATLLTAALIVIGGKVSNCLLTHRCVTYLGDISYSLYLVHWPIYTYVKLVYSGSLTAVVIGLLASVLLAILLTETYEKFYLGLDALPIAMLLILLYTANFAILYNKDILVDLTSSDGEGRELEKSFYVNSTSDPNKKYDNITAEQAIKLNHRWIMQNAPSLKHENCIPRKKDVMHGCDFNDSRNKTGPKAVIIGNSYAANIAGALNEECRNRTSAMSVFWINTCDVLVDTIKWSGPMNCVNVTDKYLPELEEIKPDVLYIITRHIDLLQPILSDDPSNDLMVQEAKRRLSIYETVVRDRIFILDALPRPRFEGAGLVQDALATGKYPERNRLLVPGIDFEAGRRRLAALLEACKKCRLFDFLPAFTEHGQFQVFDLEHGLLYFNSAVHLTPLAIEKIRPVLRKTCDSIIL